MLSSQAVQLECRATMQPASSTASSFTTSKMQMSCSASTTTAIGFPSPFYSEFSPPSSTACARNNAASFPRTTVPRQLITAPPPLPPSHELAAQHSYHQDHNPPQATEYLADRPSPGSSVPRGHPHFDPCDVSGKHWSMVAVRRTVGVFNDSYVLHAPFTPSLILIVEQGLWGLASAGDLTVIKIRTLS